MTNSPKEESRTRRWSAEALTDAVPQEVTKPLAEQLEVTPRMVRHYKSGAHPSWVSETCDQLRIVHEAGGDIWPILDHFMSYGKYRTVKTKPTAQLVEDYHVARDSEHRLQAAQDKALQDHPCGIEERRALRRHAARLSEIVAMCVELDARRVDADDYRADR